MSQVLLSLRGQGRIGLVWVVLLALAHPALLVAALVPSAPWFAAVVLLSYLAEYQAQRWAPVIIGLVHRTQINATYRQMIRDVALLVLAARTEVYEFPVLAALMVGVLTLHGSRGALNALQTAVTKRRTLPIETRNIDLSGLRIPDAPPSILMGRRTRRPLHLLIPVYLGVLLDIAVGGPVFGLVGLGIGLVAGVGANALLLTHLLRLRHLNNRSRVFQHVRKRVASYKPEVALYYSSGQDTAYQVNMWLSALTSLKRRPIIIVRERAHMSQIAPTAIPIVCLTGGSDVMDFELPDLKVVLYVGNVGKNIHMLRNNNVKHVFIGHGDSDKLASANPVSKVYDEVWVAGRAGRDRYHRARVGVRDEAIVEVGRPQLAEVEPAGSRVNPMFTVLYAPTFEGWSDDMYLSSVGVLGVKLIRHLLAHTPEIRILYKPHPLTGVRNAAVGRAHQAIMAALSAANEERLRQHHWAEVAARAESERREARQLLSRLDAQIKNLRNEEHADAAEQARDNGTVDSQRLAELVQCEASSREAFWAAVGWWSHQTITGPRPDLYSCFNQADLLISDISSVVSDFLASGKPYVVTNLEDLDETTFRAQQTAAGGAYLLSPDYRQLDDILKAVQTPDGDYLAEAREQTRRYLLGPDQPDAMHRFSAAVEALITKRAAGLDVPGEPPVAENITSFTSIPGQR
ncbi:MAG TPA: hypothetical protein VFX60_15475 [Micromonospora sp.]|nr:hypothetical protein [Micromonospora sp.]